MMNIEKVLLVWENVAMSNFPTAVGEASYLITTNTEDNFSVSRCLDTR